MIERKKKEGRALELVRKTIYMSRQKGKAVNQVTLDDDYNIPEAMPDAGFLIQEQGKLEITEVKAENGRVLVQGSLRFGVLYSEDGEDGSLHSVQGAIPVEESLNLEQVAEGDSLTLDWMLEDVSAALINSRKLGIRAVATLTLTAEELFEEDISVDISGEGEELRKKTCGLSAASLAVRKKDTCRVKDEMILPASKPNIRTLIWQDVRLANTELRPGDGEIGVRGELVVFVLYESEEGEGKTGWVEQNLPFTARIEAAGCREGMAGSVKLGLSQADLEVKPDYDGELRVLNLDVVLELDMRAYREEELELLCDAYSLKKELTPEKKATVCQRLLMNNSSRFRAGSRVDVGKEGSQILQICHCCGEALLDECTVTERGLQLEGVIQVQILYVTADDSHPVLCRKEQIPFTQEVEVPGIGADSVWQVQLSLEQVAAEMAGGSELEIRAVAAVQVLVLEQIRVEYITEIQENPLDWEKIRELPAFVICTMQLSDSLWSMAKAYRTTPERICELNGLTEDEIRPGQKLLLMKEVQ